MIFFSIKISRVICCVGLSAATFVSCAIMEPHRNILRLKGSGGDIHGSQAKRELDCRYKVLGPEKTIEMGLPILFPGGGSRANNSKKKK